MLIVEITTPDCAEGEAYVYECERDELVQILPGLLHVHLDYINVLIFPFQGGVIYEVQQE